MTENFHSFSQQKFFHSFDNNNDDRNVSLFLGAVTGRSKIVFSYLIRHINEKLMQHALPSFEKS
jgi:hypothetical protein